MWLFWFHRGRLAGDGIVSDLLFVSVDPFREARNDVLASKNEREKTLLRKQHRKSFKDLKKLYC